MQNTDQYDEIDLKEIFKLLWHKKIFIILLSFLATCGVFTYIYLKKPVYEGKALIEVGSYYDSKNIKQDIEDAFNIVNKIFVLYSGYKTDAYLKNATVIKQASNLIELEAVSSSKEELKVLLEEIIQDLKKKHQKILDEHKLLINLQVENLQAQQKMLEKIKSQKEEFEAFFNFNASLTAKINSLNFLNSPQLIKQTEQVGRISIVEKSIKKRTNIILFVTFLSSMLFFSLLVFVVDFFKKIIFEIKEGK